MKIKRLLIVISVALLSCHSDPGDQARRDELKNVLATYYDALAKKDLKKMNEVTAANFFMYDEGVIYNNESALNYVQQMSPFTAVFTFDSIKAQVGKIDASASYLRGADLNIGDTAHLSFKFLESATFRKEDGNWKIRFLQSSLRK